MTNYISWPLLSVTSQCLFSRDEYMVSHSPSTALGVAEIIFLSVIVGIEDT